MKPIIDEKLKRRFKETDQFKRTDKRPKTYHLVLARFIKNGIDYYAIAYDEKNDAVCCYVSDAKDTSKPQWISVRTLMRKSLFGKAAIRDESFAEIWSAHLDLKPHYNSIEQYFLDKKKDTEEQHRYDNIKDPRSKEQIERTQQRISERISGEKSEAQKELDAVRDNERYEWER